MKAPIVRFPVLLLPCAVLAALGAQSASELPVEWVDPDTGHRIIRLSTEPGSTGLYFHQNAYTPQGDSL
jgi:oligogalacturonide lyase